MCVLTNVKNKLWLCWGNARLERGMHGWRRGSPHYSLPALATSLLRLSTRELPGATLLCVFDPGSRILLPCHPGSVACSPMVKPMLCVALKKEKI